MGDAGRFVGKGEQTVEGWLADVHAHDKRLALHQCKADSQIGCCEALALAGGGRGEEDYLLSFLQHVLQVGTHIAEDFLHQAVLVFGYDDGMRFRFIDVRYIAYDGHVGDALDIGTPFDLEPQQTGQVDSSNRKSQTQHEGYHVDVAAVGGYRPSGTWFLNHATIVGRSCQGDGILFPLLQQHQVKIGFDFLLARDADQLAFLLGRATDTALILAGFQVEVMTSNL